MMTDRKGWPMKSHTETAGNNFRKRIPLLIVVLISVVAGFLLHAIFTTGSQGGAGATESQQIWTCSMHPQIRLPKPGKCPICDMDLILAQTTSDKESSAGVLTLSKDAKALMDIETATVQRKFVIVDVRMVGKVDYDETRLVYITAWVPGRLDRLYVDYTGIPVKKGDHLVYIYSPELLSAQEELIQAKQAITAMQQSDSQLMRDVTRQTYEAAREKLLLLGLSAQQVDQIESSGKASDHLTINSPVSGIVIHKNAKEGMYVKTGTRIYTVADLSQMWVLLDAYESDLAWLRYGQKVEFTTVAYPGEVFHGTIAFIDPVLDSATRTVKLRVNVRNPDGKLKPGMFVKAVVHSRIAAGDKVMDADLAGKWISPMHPEIVKDAPGKCDVCGMPLVRTESLGYVSLDPKKATPPLVIPATAPLITGTRAVVYVEVPGAAEPKFEGREITLGPRAGNYYIVKVGLQEGEVVVTRGAFKIDSAMQISAKPSMMNPESQAPPQGPHHEAGSVVNPEFLTQLQGLYRAYFEAGLALAGDDLASAVKAADHAEKTLDAVDMKLLQGENHMAWMKAAKSLTQILKKLSASKTLEDARGVFALYSEEIVVLARRFGSPTKKPLYEIKCPMAFNNRGASWLQYDKDVRNPYFGPVMLKCGEVRNVIPAGEGTAEEPGHE